MATYEELLNYANNYNPQQQQLGVNSFDGGMVQQEETPYQKMMRETYGNPAQAPQEEPGLFGSVVNRMSGQPQQQGTEEPSFLGSAFRGAMAQGIGTLGGQADFVAGATGSETLRNLGDSAQKAMQEYGRPHEYTFNDIFGDGLSSVWKYLSDPNGAAYDIGGGLGSTAAMAAEAALLSAALPSSVAAAGTGAVAAFATRLGLKSVAGALSKGGTAAKLIKNVIASTPLEAASESGGTYREMTTDEKGNRINPEDLDMDKVQEAMAKNFVGNLGVLGASNLLESVGIGKLFGDKMRQGILGKVRDIGTFMATNAGQNAWEEGAQTGSNLYAQGKVDNISQVVNPFEWNPEQIDAATIGGIAGLGQGTFMGGAGHVLNKIAEPQQQEGNPTVNIQNKVTNEEFGDAVAIAKHDTSTNLVDRMRNLEGRIGYKASDGTNCARTIGLAMAGTDYQDLINVDEFINVAKNKGQLQDPANYVPKPGDLAVVNDGNHIVMVSENGGTIQNGSSANGVYESAQSPLQMFGSVKYYISTSDMSSGDYGVAGNLQGVNEEQRQQEYYKNLVAQESQRRADAIREVLGAKTHEQEQQEQAVSEAQKYQQENASELGPINNYYNAFTEQELAALTPEQKQTLKNNFDSFYADKQNWDHTAIEKVQTARGMYNQMLANRQPTTTAQQQTQPQVQVQQRQTTPAPAHAPSVQQQVAQAQTPQVQQQAVPTTAPIANTQVSSTPSSTETTPSSTTQQNPVVQEQTPIAQEGVQQQEGQQRATQQGANGFGNDDVPQYQLPKAGLEQAKADVTRQGEEQRAIDVNITKNNRNILNQAKAAKKGNKDAIKYMNGLPEHIRNAAYEQIETPREKFVDMVDELYKKKKQRQSEADKELITSQANEAFKTGAAMIEQGATAEEAFDSVKDSIGTEKQKAKAKAETEKQAKAKKGETQNVVTEQKPAELQESETRESGNQNSNTESEKVEQQKGENGESTENKNQAEVTNEEKSSVSDAEEALRECVNKEFATEEERALAMSILTDKETPLKALGKRKKENKKRHDQDINDFTEAEYNALQKEGHQGVTLVPLESDPDSGRKKRASNNPKWYQELYASYGGTPSMAAVRRLAIDVLTGENTDVWADRGVPKAAIEQMEPEFEQKRAELDAIDKRFNDEEALLDSITPGIEKINAEMKKEISKYRREAKKTATQQDENVVQSNEEGANGQNVDDESGLRKLSDGNTAGSVQQNEDGRETGNLSGDENEPGEATLQTDDGLVQNEESGTAGDDGRGSGELSGRATEIRNATDEQNALRTGNDVDTAQKAYDEELDRITKDFEDGKITEEEAEKRFAEAEDKLNKALEGTQGDEGASSMPENTDYQVAATQNEQVKRSLDELITEAKKAFKGAKGFRINRNDLIFTMPNGLEMKVNIEDQILLNAADEAKARKEHGLNEGKIVVEGYAKRLDKGALVALSRESGTGTAYHEAFHTVWDWVLNDKEKAAMLKHFKPIAEKLGVAVDEAMADGYRDWLLARQQHQGTIFGKLFQKIKDFIDSARAVLTSAENVNNVYRQIESGRVWNRDAKGRFAKAEDSDKQFLVTNKKITGDTRVPVVDITSNPKFKMTNQEITKAVRDLIKDKKGNPIKFTIQGEGPIGRIANMDMGKHVFNSSDRDWSNIKNSARRKALSNVRDLLESAIYVEKRNDYKTETSERWIELYAIAGNKNNNTMTRFRIVAKEGNPGSGQFEVSDVKFYDIIKDGIISADPSKTGGQKVTVMPSDISVAELLDGVKDKNGKDYVTNGKLNYEPGVIKTSIRPSDTPLQRTQKLQEQADRYNAIELNAVTAKDPTARKYMKDQIVKRQLQGLTKKAEKAEAKKRAEKYADDLLEKLDEVVAMVEKVAKRFPAMQDWQNRPIVTITKEERERLKKEKAYRNDVMYRVIDENGKVEPVVNAFKNNAEYPVNMDFGTLCMKKEAIDAVVQILVDKGKGQNLGPTQNEMLKDLLREFGYAVPCDVCFVETKRERMLPDANKTAYAWESVLMAAKINDGKAIGERTSFTEEQEKRLKEMAGQVKGKTFKQAYEEYMPHDRRRTKTNGDKGTDLDTGVTSTAMRKLAKLFLEDPALAGKLKPTTIITSKGTDDLIRIYGGHTNIKNVLSGLYGSANAKPIEGFSVYDALSWILMDNDAITKDWDKLIDMGGGRVQSFSDYNPLLFLEYIQMVVDYQARNMPMHAYTKVPMFARLFGKTGIMINMSFVPEIIKDEHDTLDEKGKLVHAGLKYNPKTGKFDLYAWHKDSFPIEEALEIRKDKGYEKHVGTIAVGVSDKHIKKMMADPEIDMIIPYHKSGMPAAVQNKTGLKYARDYTDFQNPGITDEAKEEIVKRLANGDAKAFEKKYGEGAESYLKNRYLNYSRILVEKGDPEKAAQEYLNRCKDLGCTPVFEMFAYKDGNKEAGIVAPGYYKMLEDFRGYDSEMNPIMQGPVRLYSTDENGEKHLNLPDNVEELLTDSLADRTAQLESLEQLKNNKEFWRKADKLMEMQRADGEVRKAMVDRLSSALGSQNVKTLENGAFLDELEKLYRENGMSEESAKEKVEMFRRFDGAVYGFAKGGAIYLNENYFNANTPAHEFTHIWAKVAQTKNEALWKKGVALLENTEEWNKVVKDPLYENIIGNKDAIASEVLARIVGKRNADFIRDELLDPAKKQGRGEGLWAQIREWMKDIFKSIRSIFDPIKGRRLTYDEFTKMPLKALWDTSEHEQFRESLNELAQQKERADEVHADAIELQAEENLKEQKQAVREQYEGTDKWMKAPNGKPTNLTEDQWVTTQTPQFKEWFGDSKVVDENGEPLVVYHGTNADIESFDTSRGGEEGTTRWGKGAYFATGIGTAKTYARERAASGGKENIIPCFLKISNPFDNEMSQRDVPKKKNEAWQRLTEFLEQNDVDLPYILENSRLGVAAGIAKRAFGGEQWAANAKFREKLEEFGFDGISARLEDGTEYVVFNANQIKDASGNNVSITKDSDNIHYSITSTLGKAINKADAYANRNIRKPNENTATGRAAKAFKNTQNKNNAQTFTEWLKDRFTKFYREWIDKNDAIHEVDAAIEKITGKKLAEEDKLYNMVQGSRAYANGAAQTLVEGTPEAFRALRDSLERGIDPKDKTAMDRVNELKKDFKYATMQQVLEPIMTKDMDEKYPSYLEKNGLNNWHDAFSNYLGARRILELVRLVENKSLEFITHDKKEFTDFIDRHPEYEYFRPKAFAKGTWRTQVQKLAQANPKLAEQMAKDLAKQYKFPNGVTRADLEALVADAPKEFNTSAQVYYQLQRNTLTLMELGHLIPQAVHDQINKMYKEYCPLMIDYSDTAGLEQAIAQFGRGADSIANVGSMLKQVLQLGSERGLISPLESSYKAIQALTERAERNKVAVHFVKTVANSKELQKSGILQKVDNQHSPDAKNCIFTVLIDGKKVAFKTTQDLYGPIVGYDMPAAGIVEGFCRSAAQTLRYGATTSPSFIIRNFIRDTIFAGVSSRNGFVPVLDSARGLWAYLYNQELRGEFDAMGITAYNYFGSGKNAVKSMDKLMGEKDWNYLKSHPNELIKELIKYIPKKFEAASEAIEASTRMGEYMKARKAGKSMQEAALDARDVTMDFSRSGFYGQRVNMMVPFFNACLQGGDKFFKRMVFSKDPAVRMQTARMVGLYIMLPSAILWFFNHDEPWYEELDPHIKMNNWIIGGVRIPKPQEAGIAFGSGIEAMLDKIYNKDPKAGKEWVTAMREVLFPNLIPTVGLPLLEWATNYSLFREKAIEGNRLKRLPTEMRYNSSTTEVSKMVGKATGLSPVKLDNTIRGYTGTLGMLLAQTPDMFFESKQNLPSRPITERAMVRDFFLNDMNMNRTSEEFYELVNTAQQQHTGYGKKGKPTPAVAAVNKALRDVSKQQKEIHMITDAKNISPDRKRQLIDNKRKVLHTIQKTTINRYGSKFE